MAAIKNVTAIQVPSSIVFGGCLNVAVSHANGEYATKDEKTRTINQTIREKYCRCVELF